MRLVDSGASGVKIEGWEQELQVIKHVANNNIDVCGHIGFNPQYHGNKARIFGRKSEEAQLLIQSALSLEEAGIKMLVLEKIPDQISQIITELLSVPTIGIGAGKYCDGQVLVINDILGITPFELKHAKKYCDINQIVLESINKYKKEVENRIFPEKEHSVRIKEEELDCVKRWLESKSIEERMIK